MIEYISIISLSFLLCCFAVIILNIFYFELKLTYERVIIIFIGNNIGYLILKISQGIIENVL